MSTLIDSKIAEYWAKKDALDALDARNAPLIARRDALQAKFEPELVALNEQIKAAQAPRYDLQMEVSWLAKALGGKVGERPTPAASS